MRIYGNPKKFMPNIICFHFLLFILYISYILSLNIYISMLIIYNNFALILILIIFNLVYFFYYYSHLSQYDVLKMHEIKKIW